jgi:hypothetical protein
MLLVHQHPENTDKDPQVVFSHQTVYERTGCDVNSRWLVEWKGLCQGLLMTDLDCAGYRNGTAVLQCQEGDLVIDCTCLCILLSPPTLIPWFPDYAHATSRLSIPTPTQTLTLQTHPTSPRHSTLSPNPTASRAASPRRKTFTSPSPTATTGPRTKQMKWHGVSGTAGSRVRG